MANSLADDAACHGVSSLCGILLERVPVGFDWEVHLSLDVFRLTLRVVGLDPNCYAELESRTVSGLLDQVHTFDWKATQRRLKADSDRFNHWRDTQ